jgi:hypothetical protein
MKVALCLHGLFNSTTDETSNGHDGYTHIKKHILDVHDTDVFIHSWEVDKSHQISSLYNPKLSIFQTQFNFDSVIKNNKLNTLHNPPRPPFNVLSHLYSVTESINLAFQEKTKYDIIIKARFDLGRINRKTSGPGLGNPYAVQCINLKTDIIKDKIYMANWNHFHMGPADMWFYGSPSVMKYFTTLYESLKKNMKVGSKFHQFATSIEGNSGDLSNAIAFYKWWMIENGLWDNKINLETQWE